MSIQPFYYEELLAQYSEPQGAIALLKQYRPYLEMIPSMRRPSESVISIPLPIVRFGARQPLWLNVFKLHPVKLCVYPAK
jgi:hypothetical protein